MKIAKHHGTVYSPRCGAEAHMTWKDEHGECSYNKIKKIEVFKGLKNLRRIHLRNNEITNILGFEYLPANCHVELSGNPFHPALNGHLGGLNNYGEFNDKAAAVRYCREHVPRPAAP